MLFRALLLLVLPSLEAGVVAAAAVPFTIQVLPTGFRSGPTTVDAAATSSATSTENNCTINLEAPGQSAGQRSSCTVRSLAESAASVSAVLALGSRDVVVELQPGKHAVPLGGLRLNADHSPTNPAHTVTWRAVPGTSPGNTSVHGGVAVTGWKLSTDPTLPAGVMVAPIPPQLVGKRARHLYVGGARANRTRQAWSPPGLCVQNLSFVTTDRSPVEWPNQGDVEFGWYV